MRILIVLNYRILGFRYSRWLLMGRMLLRRTTLLTVFSRLNPLRKRTGQHSENGRNWADSEP